MTTRQRTTPWSDLMVADQTRMQAALREAEQATIADAIAELDAEDRARLEARRKETAHSRERRRLT